MQQCQSVRSLAYAIFNFKLTELHQMTPPKKKQQKTTTQQNTNNKNVEDTVLVLIKLTIFTVALRLRCGSCKLIF